MFWCVEAGTGAAFFVADTDRGGGNYSCVRPAINLQKKRNYSYKCKAQLINGQAATNAELRTTASIYLPSAQLLQILILAAVILQRVRCVNKFFLFSPKATKKQNNRE